MLVVQKHIESGDTAAMHASAQAFWTKTAPSLIQLSPAIDDIQLAPYGVAVTIYPLVTARRNATSILALGGHDLLNASSPIANRRAAALLAITPVTQAVASRHSASPTSTDATNTPARKGGEGVAGGGGAAGQSGAAAAASKCRHPPCAPRAHRLPRP